MKRKILCPRCFRVFETIFRKPYPRYRRHIKCPYCGRVIIWHPKKIVNPFEVKRYEQKKLEEVMM